MSSILMIISHAAIIQQYKDTKDIIKILVPYYTQYKKVFESLYFMYCQCRIAMSSNKNIPANNQEMHM